MTLQTVAGMRVHGPCYRPPDRRPRTGALHARLPQCLEYSKECILLIMFLTVYAFTKSNLLCCTGQLVTTCLLAINRTSTKHVPSIHFYICSIVIFDFRLKIYTCSMR